MVCARCIFLNNKANDASAIFSNSNKYSKFVVVNSHFENNTAQTNLVNMFQSSGTFENVTFINNIASKVNNGITLITSNLTFINSVV